MAGFTAANKLYGVLEMASLSYGYAITTYVGQNLGAKKYRRIRNGVRSGVYMALITSIVISGVMVITGRNILSLFVSGEAGQVKQVLDIAYKYLFIMGFISSVCLSFSHSGTGQYTDTACQRCCGILHASGCGAVAAETDR